MASAVRVRCPHSSSSTWTRVYGRQRCSNWTPAPTSYSASKGGACWPVLQRLYVVSSRAGRRASPHSNQRRRRIHWCEGRRCVLHNRAFIRSTLPRAAANIRGRFTPPKRSTTWLIIGKSIRARKADNTFRRSNDKPTSHSPPCSSLDDCTYGDNCADVARACDGTTCVRTPSGLTEELRCRARGVGGWQARCALMLHVQLAARGSRRADVPLDAEGSQPGPRALFRDEV